ncbi:putative nucleotidyltransferase with HDIG domain [Anoxybacillus vitaminiphilus]|uniref:Putative nucleotidyltransferase with HDIG domain n=1 Tax=Paranoxybacillus vitaminiphilus TaxID=581036 RepID=A0A327YQZ0_9BACL|nr:HD domain-containing phosphohydrolase [Anoxybacillus vitaminiphilus]RAK20539.1 putative nucleotidyltransferase with HDIG domain [Anoxybacillus vitaminiphilus]
MSVFNNMELCFLMRELWGKDELTFLHSYRVTEIALSFANYIGIEKSKQKEFELGALLHDIGKIKINRNILMKKGKLLEYEFVEMKKHPQFGIEILQKYALNDTAIKMTLHHHERWDGNGYPCSLEGEHIPFEARLLCLADSLEAMTGIRPYRSSLSWEEAYYEIKNGKGTQFDPALTDEFLKWMESHYFPISRNSEQIFTKIMNLE